MKRGFSLVELSIVLVIIGLLIGGILAGQSLIRAGEIRASLKQLNEYMTAVNTFNLKYDALPGDMVDATRYWGIADGATGNDATCRNASQTGPRTCNGDGDGYISAIITTAYAEIFHAWKHLSNEGLIGGLYTGKPGSGGAYESLPDINTPSGPMSNSAFLFWNAVADGHVDVNWFPNRAGNIIMYGRTASGTAPTNGLFKGSEQADIDLKLDDGLPATGLLRSFKSNSNCVTSTDPATATYVKNSSVSACFILMWLDNGNL